MKEDNLIDITALLNKPEEPPDDDDLFYQQLLEGLSHHSQLDDFYDFMERADQADSEQEALKWVKKALKIAPDNLDALVYKDRLMAKSPFDLLKKLEKTIAKGEAQLVEEGIYCDENIGDFWLVLETRPYMRALAVYMGLLVDLGMMKKAVDQAEKMLNLCVGDNLGVRYMAMALYAYFEDIEKAEGLYREYKDYDDTQLLFPLSVLYYKLGNFTKANQILTKLLRANKDTKTFIANMLEGDLEFLHTDIDAFKPGSLEEYYLALQEAPFLYNQMAAYFVWAAEKLSNKKKK
ncbi:hypothetical protein ACLGL1_07250 [Peptococcus simiae]|uniref:hypothetical protein n=1 Tax=Peptococcus simiae TaxID=1643805 RepID=UPI0039811A6F